MPDGDLFHAIRNGRASIVTDQIERFTEDGIVLKSGQTLPADLVVVATGLKLNMLGDIAVHVDGQPRRPSELLAYKGMMLSNVPNLVLAFGYTNGRPGRSRPTSLPNTCAGYSSSWIATAIATPCRRWSRTCSACRSSISVPATCSAPPPCCRARSHRKPWRVYQNYLMDMLTIRHGRIDDGVLRFDTLRPPQMPSQDPLAEAQS